MNWSYYSCDSLWLPPCPKCSNVSFFRPSHEDRLETPGFHLARSTSQKYSANYWMLWGCPHASKIGQAKGPIANRLKLAVAWRREAQQLGETCFLRGYSPDIRAIVMHRLAHPDVNLEVSREW